MRTLNDSTISLLGFDVFCGSIENAVALVLDGSETIIINTINPHSYVVQKNDSKFKQALLGSDVIIPDGSGILLAALLHLKKKIKKISGFDLFMEVVGQLNRRNGRAFFLGSTPHTLDIIMDRMSKEYPNVLVYTYSPAFKEAFNEHDIDMFSRLIDAFAPDVVFVGLTAPKQEKLILQLKDSTDVRLYCGIGAVFDFFAGTINRPSPLWVQLHLEWLVRLIGEPRRLWRRNFISTPIFILDVLVGFFRKKEI